MALNGAPDGPVTVSVAPSPSGAVTVTPAALTYDATSWNTAQTVAVDPTDDEDRMDAEVTLAHTVASADARFRYAARTQENVAVTVNDDDALAPGTYHVVSPAALYKHTLHGAQIVLRAGTSEHGNTDYWVSGFGDTRFYTFLGVPDGVTLSISNLSRSDTNYNNTLTLSYSGDFTSDWNLSVQVSSSVFNSTDNTQTFGLIPVRANPAIVLGARTLAVTEGSTGTYGVQLDSPPTGDVVVQVTSSDGVAASVAPAALTFGTASWNTAQAVTVSGVEDGDAGDERVTLTHAVDAANSADEYDGAANRTLTVTVTDDDGGLTVSPQAVTVTEGGDEGAYTVALNGAPDGPVTVSVTPSPSGAVTVTPAALTYDATSWNTARTVTVDPTDDADGMDATVTVAHTVASADARFRYAARTRENVTVSVYDDDPPADGAYHVVSPEVLFESTLDGAQIVLRAGTSEHGNADYWTASAHDTRFYTLQGVPAGVTLSVSNTSLSDAVSGGGNRNNTLTLSYSGEFTSDWNLSIRVASSAFADTDNDRTFGLIRVRVAPEIVLGARTLAVTEGSTGTYGVQLDHRPTGDVVVEVTSSDGTAASVAPAALTFGTASWNTAQAVTVTAEDDDDGVGETVTLTHAVDAANSADEYDAAPDATVTVTVTDTDVAALVVDTNPTTPGAQAATLSVTEEDPAAGSAAYTLALATEPTESVTVTPTASPPGAVTVTPAALTFSTTEWNTAQTVTAAAVGDANRNDETVTLTHALMGAAEYVAVTGADVTVEVTDDDKPGLVLSGETLTVDENAAAPYTVALNAQPGGQVMVEVRAPGDSDVTVDTDGTPQTRTLTFGTTNWATAQTVEVRAAADDDGRNDTVALTHAVTSSDADYDGLETSAPEQAPGVTVTVTDDDEIGVTVDTDLMTPGAQATTLSVAEPLPTPDGSEAEIYTVVLATQPSGPVTVTLTSDDDAVAVDTDGTPETRTLTFTANSWQTAQTVTATAVADANGVGETVTVAHAVTSTDTDYAGVSVASVTLTVTDDDTPGLAVSVAADGLTVAENASGTYTVALTTEPAGPVTVGVARTSGSPDVRAEPAALTFAAMAWNTAQTVTVHVADDDDGDEEPPTVLSHTVSGTGDTVSYPTTLAAVTVEITGTDDDEAGLVVDPQMLGVTEPQMTPDGTEAATYTVRLATLPGGDVTVTLATSPPGAVTVVPAALTYTAAEWNTAQTVTATAQQDDGNTDNETVTVSHGVAAVSTDTEYNYAARAAEQVTVQVTDNDAPNLRVSAGDLTGDGITEGTAEPYTVALTTQPSCSGGVPVCEVGVTVTVAGGDRDGRERDAGGGGERDVGLQCDELEHGADGDGGGGGRR